MKAAAFCLGLLAADAAASALGDLANGMAQGSWAELKTTGYSHSLLSTGAVDLVLNFADAGIWDPARKEVRFTGGGHQESNKTITYSEAGNSWAASAPPSNGPGHAYHHNAFDPATGTWYYRLYATNNVYKNVNGAWSSATRLPGDANSYACCGSLNWYPEMGQLTFWSAGSIFALKGGTWSQIASGLDMSDYNNVAEYLPKYRLLIGGGGNESHKLHILDKAGTVTSGIEAPVAIGIYSAVMTADPYSGELLVLGRDKSFWAYNPGLKKWRSLPAPTVPLFASSENPVEFTVAVPIPDYNVVMVLRDAAVYLYKHKPEGPIPESVGLPPARMRQGAAPGLLILPGGSGPGEGLVRLWNAAGRYVDPASRRLAGGALLAAP